MMASRWARLYKSTPAELALEDAVAALGVPYRGQFPGWLYGLRYYPDFILPTLGLVIEVDDDSHREKKKAEEDEQRSRDIEDKWGYRVVRCTNEEALEDPSGTVKRLLSEAGLWPLPSRTPPIREALPQVHRAPQRNRREAGRRARRSARAKRRGSS